MCPDPVNPSITKDRVFSLIGCVFFGDPFQSAPGWDTENKIGKTWKRFEALYKKNQNILKDKVMNENFGFELHMEPTIQKEEKELHIFVGVEVVDLKNIPLEMYGMVLPKTKYAIFTFKGKEMFKGGDYIWQDWLPKSNYVESFPFMMQAYDYSRFHGLHDEKSELDWWVPVKTKKK